MFGMSVGAGVLLEGFSIEDGYDLTALQFLHFLHKETPIFIKGLVLPVGEVASPRG